MEPLPILLSFIIALCFSLITIPRIVEITRTRKLFSPVNRQKMYTTIIPPFGGVAIFIGFVLSTLITSHNFNFEGFKYIKAAVLLMFFIGLYDDLMELTAIKKFIFQGIAALLLFLLGNIRFTNLHGIMGIYELNYFTSFLFSIFVIIAIINAYNLIDGIDGLASGLGILAVSVFGFWFYATGHTVFSILSFALVGSLSGFFIFNVFGQKNKVFMGDTGSLVIGLVISTLVIKFNEFSLLEHNSIRYVSPAVSLSIIIVPIIDTLRVTVIRISHGKSPFSADHNHLHHRLLELIPNHLKVTLTLIGVNISLIAFTMFMNTLKLDTTLQFFIVLVVGIILSFVPSWLIKYGQNSKATLSFQFSTSLKRY